jgi:regulator of replication initiation timing
LDKIKKQYKRELLPLTQQRERLDREIEDLKTQRDLLLEETTVLNVRNEELAQLTAQYVRRAEAAEASVSSGSAVTNKEERTLREKHSQSFEKARVQQSSQSLASHSSTTLNEDIHDTKLIRIQKPEALDVPSAPFRPPKFLKWSGKASREHLGNRELAIHVVPPENTRQKARNAKEHKFQQVGSGLRIGRCEHCGDKMWGSLLRCSSKLIF